MRLIDASELVQVLCVNMDSGEQFDKATHCVDAMPTVDAVPVRHGRWKKSGNWGRVYKCDQCGNYLDFDGVNVGRGSANYCPNCGARMDEGEG